MAHSEAATVRPGYMVPCHPQVLVEEQAHECCMSLYAVERRVVDEPAHGCHKSPCAVEE